MSIRDKSGKSSKWMASLFHHEKSNNNVVSNDSNLLSNDAAALLEKWLSYEYVFHDNTMRIWIKKE